MKTNTKEIISNLCEVIDSYSWGIDTFLALADAMEEDGDENCVWVREIYGILKRGFFPIFTTRIYLDSPGLMELGDREDVFNALANFTSSESEGLVLWKDYPTRSAAYLALADALRKVDRGPLAYVFDCGGFNAVAYTEHGADDDELRKRFHYKGDLFDRFKYGCDGIDIREVELHPDYDRHYHNCAWLVWCADCMSPPMCVVGTRRDSPDDAIDDFIEQWEYAHINDDILKDMIDDEIEAGAADENSAEEKLINDGTIGYGPNGQVYDSENVSLREIELLEVIW